jgi:Zn-dependent protease
MVLGQGTSIRGELWMLAEPQASAYDVHFSLFGIPIRIAWTFWLLPLVLGYELVRSIDRSLPNSPGILPLMGVCVLGVFASLLVHELGHALMMRRYGVHAGIVLYHFGGLAIPLAGRQTGRTALRLPPAANIAITAAGPLAQLLAAALVIGLLMSRGFSSPVGPQWFEGLWSGELRPISSPIGFVLAFFFLWPSIFWAILNLVPVLPLDGGQIAREVIALLRGPAQLAWQLSLFAAVLMAVWGYRSGQLFLMILFASLAYSSFEQLQLRRGL